MTKWKLVPVDPTPEMVVAGIDTPVIVTEDDKIDQHDDYRRVYASMLEAAPQPPKLSDERILHHLDAIIKASGSGMKNYSMHKTIEDMKQAVRAIEREILGGGHE